MHHPDTTSYSLIGFRYDTECDAATADDAVVNTARVQYGADVRVEWVASGARGDLGVWEALRGDMMVGRVVVRRV